MLIYMEQTIPLLVNSNEDIEQLFKSGEVKEIENLVKYLKINETDS